MSRLPDATIAAKYVIKTHYIMRVLEFHPETQTVDLIQDVFEMTNSPFGTMLYKNEFGNTVACLPKRPEILYGVPVKQERWGQFEIQACPIEGDTGYIEVFVDDIQDWIKNGSRSIPWSQDMFVKKNCVFVPFIPNKKNAAKDYPTDNTKLVIKSKNASITITDDGEKSSISLGAQTVEVSAPEGISITGNMNVEGEVTANGIPLSAHTHTVPAGAAITTSQGAGTISSNISVPKPDKKEEQA